MNNSYITRLENKYDVIIHAGTIQSFSGNWLKMQFDMSTNKGVRNVMVKAKEPVYAAIERALSK